MVGLGRDSMKKLKKGASGLEGQKINGRRLTVERKKMDSITEEDGRWNERS